MEQFVDESSLTCSGKAVINGVELHYEVRGNGSHPILCIPAALLTARSQTIV